jgi:hypothetical protein
MASTNGVTESRGAARTVTTADSVPMNWPQLALLPTASSSKRNLFFTDSFSATAHHQGQPGLSGLQELIRNLSAFGGQSDLLYIPPMGCPHTISDEEFLVDQPFKRSRHRVLHIFLRRPFCVPLVKLFQPAAFPPLSLRVVAGKENIPLKAAQHHRLDAPITPLSRPTPFIFYSMRRRQRP